MALAALLATLLAAPPGRAGDAVPASKPGVVGPDDRVMLDPTRWPWTALGRLNRDGGGFCTGALVAADVVLTADHCLYHRVSGRLLAPQRIHFLAALRRDEWRAHARGRAYVRPPGAADDRRRKAPSAVDDWALIVLEHPLDGRPLPVRRLAPGERPGAPGSPDRLLGAGYGFDRPYLLSLDASCMAWRDPARPGVLRHTCDAVPGTSGSPLLIRNDDGYAVVGVVHGFSRGDGTTRGLAVDTGDILAALAALAADAGTAGR